MWDYDRFGSNEFLGEVLIDLSNIANSKFDEEPLWHLLNLHQNAGGDLTTVPPICPTPGLMVSLNKKSTLHCGSSHCVNLVKLRIKADLFLIGNSGILLLRFF